MSIEKLTRKASIPWGSESNLSKLFRQTVGPDLVTEATVLQLEEATWPKGGIFSIKLDRDALSFCEIEGQTVSDWAVRFKPTASGVPGIYSTNQKKKCMDKVSKVTSYSRILPQTKYQWLKLKINQLHAFSHPYIQTWKINFLHYSAIRMDIRNPV